MSFQMSYSGAAIATILWTEYGFQPKPSISEVGKELTNILAEKGILDDIGEELHVDDHHAEELKYSIDYSLGIEHIKLCELRDVNLNPFKIESFTSRIYMCDNTQNMKGKIVVLSYIKPDSNMNPIEMSNIIVKTYQFNERICKLIYSKIPTQFSLGRIIYICNITSIESSDEFIDAIDTIKLNRFEAKKLDLADKYNQKLLESYYVLLSNSLCYPKDSVINWNFVIDTLRKFDVKQSKMYFYQAHQKIPAITFNFSLPDNGMNDTIPHRIISNLTGLYCGGSVTKKITKSYLSRT